MKDCQAMVMELPGYVGGKLAEADAGPVRAHLQACPSCRAELLELEQLDLLLNRALPSITPSATFASRFANRLAAEVDAEEEATRGGVLGWLLQPWLVPVAAAAMLAAVMLSPWFSGTSQSPLHLPQMDTLAKQAAPAPDKMAAPEIVASTPPPEVIERPELFVDYSVIRDLDVLESGKGDTESRNG